MNVYRGWQSHHARLHMHRRRQNIYKDELSVTCKNNYIAWNKSNVHGSQSSLKKCWHSDKEISVIIWKRANSKPCFKTFD